MNRATPLLLFAGLLAACAPVGAGGRALTYSSLERLSTIEGRLVEVRCYLQERKQSEEQTFCAATDARGNLPLGLVDEKGRLTYLTDMPSRLASLVSERVQIRGLLTVNHQFLRPVAVSRWQDGHWTYVPN